MFLFRTIVEMIIYIGLIGMTQQILKENGLKFFKPHLQNTLKKLVYKIGFTDITLYNVLVSTISQFR